MCLLMQNMWPNILNNGGERISNCIMCDFALSPWTQQNKCIFIGFMAWPRMHREKPWTMGWWTPSLAHKIEEKMLKTILKDGMNGWPQSQTPKHGHAQDLSWMWWQFENNSKMMLKNECSCTLPKMLSWKQSTLLSNNYSNGGMTIWVIASRWSWAHLRWTWNGSGPKLLAFTTPQKNGL
jgi:hypothetical protein